MLAQARSVTAAAFVMCVSPAAVRAQGGSRCSHELMKLIWYIRYRRCNAEDCVFKPYY